MTLSDADCTLLVNALDEYERAKGLLIAACEVIVPWLGPDDCMPFMPDRQLADTMYLILASEGRSFELPE